MSEKINFGSIEEKFKKILSLDSSPVAVFLLSNNSNKNAFSNWKRIEKHRYCQALMRACKGECVVLENQELSCPAAAAAFDVRPLPSALAGGEGLIGFGITRESAVGKKMFEEMPHLDSENLDAIAFSPLKDAPCLPDVVVVEAEVEKLMWLILADVNLSGGLRRQGNTAVLQAVCVDATVIPYKQKRLNFSFGCYGCREATGLGQGETVLGFPGEMLKPLEEMLEYFSQKAISRSRDKNAYKILKEK